MTESGLLAYSGLCYGIGNRIDVSQFGEYIIHALKAKDECSRVACGLISDICCALQEGTA